jgi:hypothetical protein
VSPRRILAVLVVSSCACLLAAALAVAAASDARRPQNRVRPTLTGPAVVGGEMTAW